MAERDPVQAVTATEEAALRLGIPACSRCKRPSVRVFVLATEHVGGVTHKGWFELVSGPVPSNAVCEGCMREVNIAPSVERPSARAIVAASRGEEPRILGQIVMVAPK